MASCAPGPCKWNEFDYFLAHPIEDIGEYTSQCGHLKDNAWLVKVVQIWGLACVNVWDDKGNCLGEILSIISQSLGPLNATYDHLVLQEGHQPLDPVVKLMVAQSHGVKIE